MRPLNGTAAVVIIRGNQTVRSCLRIRLRGRVERLLKLGKVRLSVPGKANDTHQYIRSTSRSEDSGVTKQEFPQVSEWHIYNKHSDDRHDS